MSDSFADAFAGTDWPTCEEIYAPASLWLTEDFHGDPISFFLHEPGTLKSDGIAAYMLRHGGADYGLYILIDPSIPVADGVPLLRTLAERQFNG